MSSLRGLSCSLTSFSVVRGTAAVTIDRGAKQRNGGAGTATATEPTREHKQYAIQGPTRGTAAEQAQIACG